MNTISQVKSPEELKKVIRDMEVSNPQGRVWSIKFDLPENGKSILHIQKNEFTIFVIRFLDWSGTLPIRKLVRFGSNHDQKPTTWELLSEYLSFVAIVSEASEEYENA